MPEKTNKTERLSITATKKTRQNLRILAAKKGTSMSQIIENLVAAQLLKDSHFFNDQRPASDVATAPAVQPEQPVVDLDDDGYDDDDGKWDDDDL